MTMTVSYPHPPLEGGGESPPPSLSAAPDRFVWASERRPDVEERSSPVGDMSVAVACAQTPPPPSQGGRQQCCISSPDAAFCAARCSNAEVGNIEPGGDSEDVAALKTVHSLC